MPDPRPYSFKKALAWAMYDWANSAFVTTVVAGFFPVFFKQYWSAGADVTLSTFKLGAANSAASVIVACLAPVLGAIADRGGAKKRFLFTFTSLGVVMTGGLYLVTEGQWQLAAGLYVLAVIGFAGGNIFYDALLVGVAPEGKRDFVSALGYSLGYLGGGTLFAFNIAMTLYPASFGLDGAEQAVRLSLASVALWWAAFSLPLMFWVKEPASPHREKGWQAARAGLTQLAATFGQVRRLKVVGQFLVAYWLYIDGVDTIINMAVDYGLSLGFTSRSLLTALLITQFVGFPATIAFGWLGKRIGPKICIIVCIMVYMGVTVWGYLMQSETEFYLLAVVIGLVQGGVQSLSRSFYARIIPPGQAAEFYGFYNMLGKFAAVIGPLLMGWVSLATGNPRYSIIAVCLLFVPGVILLSLVDEKEGRRLAEKMDD